MTAPKPMIAADHLGGGDVEFPLLVQPKLDGFRCLARRERAGWMLYSRSGKVLDLPHITSVLSQDAWLGLTLDGELYIHGRSFQWLTSAIRQRTTDVEFHVFDGFVEGNDQIPAAERLAALGTFQFTGPVKRLAHHVITFQHQLDQLYTETLAAGYEGLILRDPTAAYEHKLTWAMQKLKPHYDSEFLVVGWRVAKNAPHLVVLNVRNDITAATFDVCFPGILHDPCEAIGQMLTCRFSGRTDGLLPRHAVAVRFRDDRAIEPGGADLSLGLGGRPL